MDEIIKKAYLSRLEDCLPVDFSDGVKFGVGWCKDKKFTEEDMKKCWNACLDFNKPAGLDSGINYQDFINSLNKQD